MELMCFQEGQIQVLTLIHQFRQRSDRCENMPDYQAGACRREQKRKDDAHDGSFRKVSVGVCRGAFRHRPQCPQRRFPRGRTAPPGRRERSRIRENAHGKRRSGLLANGLRTFRKQGRSPLKRAPALRVIRRSSRKRASGPAGKAPRTGTACPARRRRSS